MYAKQCCAQALHPRCTANVGIVTSIVWPHMCRYHELKINPICTLAMQVCVRNVAMCPTCSMIWLFRTDFRSLHT